MVIDFCLVMVSSLLLSRVGVAFGGVVAAGVLVFALWSNR